MIKFLDLKTINDSFVFGITSITSSNIKYIKSIDIDPYIENSISNFGLFEFKESIGCEITTQLTLLKNIV
ncbi:hypothetical protein N8215_03215 [Flavobacteriaceae bacterium]|nr:hypothetical protein [Flavobacteriaceae bacterium]